MVSIGEELDIEPRLTELGSTSNEKQRFTLVGAISSVLINSTYNPTHSPYSATPSCPMLSLKMVSLRSTKLSIANDNLEGSLNKPMVYNNEIVADMNVEKEYVNSPVNNPNTCSLLGRSSKILLQQLKTSMVIYFPYIVIPLFGFLVFLWGVA
jgi:hypothetical protein